MKLPLCLLITLLLCSSFTSASDLDDLWALESLPSAAFDLFESLAPFRIKISKKFPLP